LGNKAGEAPQETIIEAAVSAVGPLWKALDDVSATRRSQGTVGAKQQAAQF